MEGARPTTTQKGNTVTVEISVENLAPIGLYGPARDHDEQMQQTRDTIAMVRAQFGPRVDASLRDTIAQMARDTLAAASALRVLDDGLLDDESLSVGAFRWASAMLDKSVCELTYRCSAYLAIVEQLDNI